MKISHKNKCVGVSSQIFYKIGVLKSFTNFAGKHLCWSLSLIKLQTWGLRLQRMCFPVNFAKFLTTTFLTEHLWWLLLYHSKMHLYRLRIHLTILLDCSMTSYLFRLNFIFFLRACILSSLIPSFSFLSPVKRLVSSIRQILNLFSRFSLQLQQ